MKLAITSLLILALGITLSGCSALGTSPDKTKKEKFKNSENYRPEKEQFDNRIPDLIDKMWDRNSSFSNMVDFFKTIKDLEPKKPLPEVKPDVAEFLKPNNDLKAIWFGHSSFLLNMDGTIVLVDPIFSGSASPVSFIVQRFQEPTLSLKELPAIDYILISHDHYDHLDEKSVRYFKNEKTIFVTPLGVGSHLEGWGIRADQIIERDWWQEAEFAGIKFIATPAQHFSGRGIFDQNETLWASWVLQSKNHNIYFSGDSGYDTHFKQIGEKLGPFDVAFLESGQYNEKWEEVHMLPKQGVQAYRDLKAKRYFPIHWGMFVLAKHTWYDPIEQLFKFSTQNRINLIAPKLGQIVNLSEDFALEPWWQPMKDDDKTFENSSYNRPFEDQAFHNGNCRIQLPYPEGA